MQTHTILIIHCFYKRPPDVGELENLFATLEKDEYRAVNIDKVFEKLGKKLETINPKVLAKDVKDENDFFIFYMNDHQRRIFRQNPKLLLMDGKLLQIYSLSIIPGSEFMEFRT